MAKSPKKREDLNQLAARIVAEAAGTAPKTAGPAKRSVPKKKAAAVIKTARRTLAN